MQSNKKYMATEAPPDGGYGWVVVTGSLLINMCYSASQVSFAIFLPEFAQAFPHKNNAAIATIGSVQIGVILFGAIVSGLLMSFWSCRVVTITGLLMSAVGNCLAALISSYEALIITYSLLAGLGIGMAGVAGTVMVQHYFEKRRALAAGISTAGTSLGVLVFAPCLRLLINHYSWRSTLMWMAGFAMQSVVIAMFFRPLRRKMQTISTDHKPESTTTSLQHISSHKIKKLKKCMQRTLSIYTLPCKAPMFHWFMACTFLEAFGAMTFYSMNADRAIYYGINKDLASYLPAVYGLISTVARVATGCFGDQLSVNRVLFYGCTIIVQGAVVAMSIFSEEIYAAQVTFAALHGFVFGITIALLPAALVDVVQLSGLPGAYALNQATRGLGTFAALPLAGYLLDVTGDYSSSFLVAGCICCMGGVCLLIPSLLKRKEMRKILVISEETVVNDGIP